MIARITAIPRALDTAGPVPTLLLEPPDAPICYQAMLPAYLADDLARELDQPSAREADPPHARTPRTFHTLQYLESVSQGAAFLPRLIAFPSVADRAFFELFTTVKGLGYKRALRALAVPPAKIAHDIVSRDAKALTALPEIGKKLAETIILELADKAAGFVVTGVPAQPAGVHAEPKPGRKQASLPPVAEDAVAALCALGEPEPDARARVSRILDASQPGDPHTTESLLRSALASR